MNRLGQTPPDDSDGRGGIHPEALGPSICRNSNLVVDRQEMHLARRPRNRYLAAARKPKARVEENRFENLFEGLGGKEAGGAWVE